MADRTIGVVIDGATGRLGTTQHLRALLDIRREGGLSLKNGDLLMPEPLLLGRNRDKLAALADKSGGLRWSIDRDACLADPASISILMRPRPAAAPIVPVPHSLPANTFISK